MDSKHEYPIYIISKGRAYNPLTANYFELYNVDYNIVVEPQEYNDYVNKLGEHRVIALPFSNLGLGSYPARNFCWEHSKQRGYKYHWVFDDNIHGFAKWVDGKRRIINEGSKPFAYVENYVKKHNIDIGGFEYMNFSQKLPKHPFKNNVHVYSALLIRNDMPYRWRLKYNEDIDLCLQVLHNGGKTCSCVYYLTRKVSTSTKMKGGNQDELYKGNDPKKKLLKSKMLESVWPQYVRTVIRFNRIHHFIDWKIFKKKK